MAQLNEGRQHLLLEATELTATRCRLESSQREFDSAHGLTPPAAEPSRVAEVQIRGGALGRALGTGRPIYDTPIKNMRAAQAVIADLEFLEGEELLQQQQRIRELIIAANEQQQRFDPAQPSGSVSGRTGDPERALRDTRQTSSHATSASRSGRHRSGPSRHNRTTTAGDGNAGETAGTGRVQQTELPVRPARRPEPAPEAPAPRCPVANRIGLRVPLADRLAPREPYDESDARHRLDRLARSTALEEESSVGPACFGPRIREEPFPKGFSLPRDSPKYTGATKPED